VGQYQLSGLVSCGCKPVTTVLEGWTHRLTDGLASQPWATQGQREYICRSWPLGQVATWTLVYKELCGQENSRSTRFSPYLHPHLPMVQWSNVSKGTMARQSFCPTVQMVQVASDQDGQLKAQDLKRQLSWTSYSHVEHGTFIINRLNIKPNI
jgi:hypothetical protein